MLRRRKVLYCNEYGLDSCRILYLVLNFIFRDLEITFLERIKLWGVRGGE